MFISIFPKCRSKNSSPAVDTGHHRDGHNIFGHQVCAGNSMWMGWASHGHSLTSDIHDPVPITGGWRSSQGLRDGSAGEQIGFSVWFFLIKVASQHFLCTKRKTVAGQPSGTWMEVTRQLEKGWRRACSDRTRGMASNRKTKTRLD